MSSTATNIKVCVVDKAYQKHFMKGMQKLRQNEEYTDVTLQSGDVHIRCHRNVLEAASDYFKGMFQCGLKESLLDTVQLTTDPKILTSIVDYIYTGEIALTADNVESLVKAGDLLLLDCLKATCADFMVAQVELHNYFELYRFSTLYRLDHLQEMTRHFIFAEFKTVALNAEFKELSSTDLVELIKHDDVNVEDEDVVLEAVLGWIRHDLDNRKSSLEAIIEHVRLPYCSRDSLRHLKDMHDLLTPKCFEYLHEAMAFQADTVHQHGIHICRTVPRTNFRMKSCLLVVGGMTIVKRENVEHNHCQYYKEDINCWESLEDLPLSVSRYYSVCRVGRCLLLTGGLEKYALNQCWLYDMVSKKWESMPPLITARYHHRSVSLGDCVYVVGGMAAGEKDVLASVECMNLKRRQWSPMPDMAQPVAGANVVTYGSNIFVFGGRDAQSVDLSCTQVLDTTRGIWGTRSDTPDVCVLGAAVSLNDSVYVVGGFGRTCLKYNPASDSWTKLSRPQQKHGNAPAVVWRGSILVAGGGIPVQKSSVIEAYDPLTDIWSICNIESLSEKLTCHCMFNIDVYST